MLVRGAGTSLVHGNGSRKAEVSLSVVLARDMVSNAVIGGVAVGFGI